jgi:hypothetical protein
MTGKRAGAANALSILVAYERGNARTPVIIEQNFKNSRRVIPRPRTICCTVPSIMDTSLAAEMNSSIL